MSYQVLARKWRPSNFSQVAGQAHVLKSLINALDNQRLHHAYLFTGTRGVGKTTLARILAKCLNCEKGISSTPCEQCESCIAINEGRFIDLIEVDAASKTKVDDTREMLENVQYTPARGRFKVYLIDEVHMLSNHSFNALLKTLEEPPPHVKFLFATTDPQKLPVTILSRCLQFNLKNLTPQIIVEYLKNVLKDEEIGFDDEAIWQIAAAATGSMRDGLTLVDQAISYCQGEIKTDGVIEMLGVPEQQQVFALLEAMGSGNVQSVIELIALMAEQTPDYVHTLDSLLSMLHRVAIAQVVPEATDNSFGDKQQVIDLATKFTGEDIQLFYQIGVKGRDELRMAGELRAGFEMLLIRMMVFSPNYADVQAGKERQGTAHEATVEPVPVAEPEIEKKKNEVAAQTAVAIETGRELTEVLESSPEPLPESAPDLSPAPPPEQAAEPPPIPVLQAEQTASPEQKLTPAEAAAVNGEDAVIRSHDEWLALYPKLGITGIVANVLANVALDRVEGTDYFFKLDQSQSAVFSEELVPKLSRVLSDYLGQPAQAHIEIASVDKETAALLSQRLKRERHSEMVNEFEQDENVQQLLRHFSGTLAKESIAPVEDRGS